MVHAHCTWIPKATDTHSEYVILLAFPQQQWLHESTSMSRYAYIACLVQTSPYDTSYKLLKLNVYLQVLKNSGRTSQ